MRTFLSFYLKKEADPVVEICFDVSKVLLAMTKIMVIFIVARPEQRYLELAW
jgi:hypothetical protein